jgi:SAM-dependent methyltransferase
LDVGCGSGGRFIRLLQNKGFKITEIDVSLEMITLARHNHPEENFPYKVYLLLNRSISSISSSPGIAFFIFLLKCSSPFSVSYAKCFNPVAH